VVATGAEGVIGFAGVLDVDGAQMVTDLFVDAGHRGRGFGGALLRKALVKGRPSFTFASAEPAALAAYLRVGMRIHWPLLTMRGPAEGGSTLPERPWSGGNEQVVRHLSRTGAVSTGRALVTHRGPVAQVHRVEASPDAAVEVLAEVSEGLPGGTVIELSVPAGSSLLAALVLLGYRTADVDIHCATPGLVLHQDLAAVHRGLC
jgi:GNAT superfamily N-acetyltransferase